MDFVRDYKYIRVRVWISPRVSPAFSTRVLDFIWVMSTPLTPSWQDNTSGLIMARSNVHFTSLSFSLFPVLLFIHTFISRPTSECVGSFLWDPVGVYCSILFDQCVDGFYFLCDSTWLLCPLKKCQVGRSIESILTKTQELISTLFLHVINFYINMRSKLMNMHNTVFLFL